MLGLCLSTTLAHVWLLASVNTLVDGQSRPLDELFATVWIIAYMGTDAAVDTLCGIVSGTFFGVEAQAPYRGERGRCVARSPSRMSSKQKPWVVLRRTRVGHPAADSVGRAYVAVVDTRDRVDWECSCCYC